jgi:hypothetical protein
VAVDASAEIGYRVADTFCAAVVHWSGPLDQGEAAMKPFREVAPVVAEMVAPMPYTFRNAAFEPIVPKGIRSYWTGAFVAELTDAAIDGHIAHGVRGARGQRHHAPLPINGGCHEVGADETAFGYRHATYSTVIVCAWPDPAQDTECIRWVRDYYQAIAPDSEPGGYLNFMAEDDQAKVPDNYGTYSRLAQIKRPMTPTTWSTSTRTASRQDSAKPSRWDPPTWTVLPEPLEKWSSMLKAAANRWKTGGGFLNRLANGCIAPRAEIVNLRL